MELFKRKIVELPLLRGVGEFAQHNLDICQERVLHNHNIEEGSCALVEHVGPLLRMQEKLLVDHPSSVKPCDLSLQLAKHLPESVASRFVWNLKWPHLP